MLSGVRPAPRRAGAARPAAQLLLTVALAVAVSACGYEESYTGLGDRALPGDPLRPTIPEVNCGDSCQCSGGGEGEGEGADEGRLDVASLAGRGYRFDELTIGRPLSELIASQVNGYFSEELAKGTLNVLVTIDADDREAKTVAAQLGPGELVDETYRLAAGASAVSATLNGAHLVSSSEASLDFPNAVLVPPVLPIRRLTLDARFTPDGERLDDGVLRGALLAEDARGVKLGAMTLHDFLILVETPLDLDTDDDGTPDAWRFEGNFAAARVALQGAAAAGGQ